MKLLGVTDGLAGLLRQAGLGAEANRVDKIDDVLLEVGSVCLQEEYELCRDEHILHRIVPVVLGIMRQSELLGNKSPAMEQVIEKGKELAGRCLNFELEFESEVKGTLGTMTYTSSMTSKVPIHFKWDGVLAGDALTGKAPQKNEEFTLKDAICSVVSTQRGGAEFEVTALGWDIDYRGKDDKVGFVRDMVLSYVSGVSTESYSMRCPGGGTATSGKNSALWSGAYGMIHAGACMAGLDVPAQQGDPSQVQSPELPEELGDLMKQLEGQDLESMTPDQILQLLAAAQEAGGDQDLGGLELALSALQPGAGAATVGGLIRPPDPADCASTRDWQVPAGETYATKEWTLSSGGMKDVGSFTLKHTPS